METKIIAAEIATGAGTTTVITSSKNPMNILNIIDYNTQGSDNDDESRIERPPHTVFLASPTPLRDLKSWTSHTLFPAGTVVIDAGAHQVLSRRDSGGRLLPIGVLDVIGGFASGQAVRIAIRKPKSGVVMDVQVIPLREEKITGSDSPFTQPTTPTLAASISMSSSIASLEPLSRSGSSGELSTASNSLETLREGEIDQQPRNNSEEDGWEIIEVGRGLANYNWAEIRKVKGLKRFVIYLSRE